MPLRVHLWWLWLGLGPWALGLAPSAVAQTSALPVNVVLMLPNTWSGETFSGMTFHPTNQGRTLLLWPCNTCGGTSVGGTNVAGITNLNGITNASQTFAVGTSGNDFNIVSAGTVHTFHLPTASATVRGALSGADWTTFNAKQGAITVQTQGVTLAVAPTTWNFTNGLVGEAAGAVMTVGISSSSGPGGGLSGTTNFLSLSAQAAKLPATNYPGIEAGWQAWETIYAETNSEGSRANLNASWQLVVPPDYATNSLQLLINYSLLNTNGPNASNVIFGVSCLAVRSGTTNNVHTNDFGFTAWGTNEWIAKYDGTNIVTNMVISLGTNAAIQAQDLAVVKVTRDAVNDTFGKAIAVHGLQLYYTRP